METSARPDVRLFGSPLRTGILILTALLEETYPAELAAFLNARPTSVIRFIDELERDGVLSTRLIGRQRRVALNPNYYAYVELNGLLARIGRENPEYMRILSTRRRRPRRRGKPL
jgi:DNA-binding Lrp family transcriptional regulator